MQYMNFMQMMFDIENILMFGESRKKIDALQRDNEIYRNAIANFMYEHHGLNRYDDAVDVFVSEYFERHFQLEEE